jgi:hypothetical protein
MIAWLNAYKNLVLLGVGAAFVVFVFAAGARHNERKHEAATAELNAPILEQRGKDEAELAAEAKAAETVDTSVKGALAQKCLATEETAKLLAGVR